MGAGGFWRGRSDVLVCFFVLVLSFGPFLLLVFSLDMDHSQPSVHGATIYRTYILLVSSLEGSWLILVYLLLHTYCLGCMEMHS